MPAGSTEIGYRESFVTEENMPKFNKSAVRPAVLYGEEI